MDGSLALPVRAGGRPRINVDLPHLGLTAYRTIDEACILAGGGQAWLGQFVGGLRAGDLLVLTGDHDLAAMLATQIAIGIGALGGRSLMFAMTTAPLALVSRARTLTAAWNAEDATRAITSIDVTPEASDLRDLRAMLDLAVDPRHGAHRGTALVVLDRIVVGGRAKAAARAADDFAECSRTCRNSRAAILALIAGPEEATAPLIARADVVLHLNRQGGRRCRLTAHRSRLPTQNNIILERDDTTGELRPAKDESPYIGRARAWIGGDDPIAEIHAIVSPVVGQRPRIVANGLSDRRVHQALALIDRLPFIEFRPDEHDVEVLLTGDTCYRTGFGLATVAAIASSIIRRAVPDDVILTGEVGLDRRVRPLSAVWVESITAAAADRQIKPSTRLLVASRTAKQLDGLNCEPVAAPTLDAALLQLWPDLH